MKSLGQIAYEAARIGPEAWEALPLRARMHWALVGSAVEREVGLRRCAVDAGLVADAEAGRTSPTRLGWIR